MAMGRRTDRARTPGLRIAANELPTTGGHPFYQRLNQVLDAHGFDAFVESQCAPFYADGVGRPSLTPGTYFRLLLIGYFEGIDSERGIAWRTADSLPLRGFLGMKSKVHPTYKTKYRVANWPAYNQALVRRGDVTVWVAAEAIAGTVNLVCTVRCSASRSFALARSARTRRRIPFDERPLSEHAVVPRPE